MPRFVSKKLLRRLNMVLAIVLVCQSLLPASPPLYAQSAPEQDNPQLFLPIIPQTARLSSNAEASADTFATENAVPHASPLSRANQAAFGLAITANGTTIELSWASVTNSQSYEVHRSLSPFFAPSAATRLQTLPASATTYADPGAAGDPAVNHFYIVRAVNGSQSSDSNAVGEIDYPLNNTGGNYSLLALPFVASGIVDATSLASRIRNVAALLKWHPSTQTFRFFAAGSGDNFPLAAGDLVFVLLNSGAPSVFTMTGTVAAIQYTLTPGGYNFITLPLPRADLTNAAGVASDMTGVQSLLAWNEATQTFRLFTPPGAGDNFSVKPGAPLVVQLTSAGPTQWPSEPAPPVLNAPALDRTVATDLYNATAFFYAGNNPIQTGVQPGAIEPLRAAVMRGRVLDRAGAPVPNVTITVLNHPEWGQTLSRADGVFDMAVNGGGALTVEYQKTGYPPVQRTLEPDWQAYEWLPDVVLTPYDTQVTTVDLTAPADFQVARGSISTDEDGARQATVLFPQGTVATITRPDGSTQTLSTMNVRFTEYTVGATGPDAMPGDLPPQSGYTYAVELTVDEALANGVKVNGKDVVFNQPVFFYLDNFLNIPAGEGVPVGYYDNDRGVWAPTDDGLVIKIASINNGLADLIVDGSGQPATATQLATLGITDAERRQLASLYTVNKSLWRVAITHFSTYDCNYGVAPQAGAKTPDNPNPVNDPKEDSPICQNGSVIECQNQVLGETINLVGTPLTLHYRSDRVPGRQVANTAIIPLSGSTTPSVLKRIELQVLVAGQVFTKTFPALPNQSFTFTWNGLDGYGRVVQGRQSLSTRIGYVYDGFYARSAGTGRGFGISSGFGIPGNIPARQEVTLWQEAITSIGVWDAKTQGLGGWTLNVHHMYDPVGQVLYLGDGQRRSVQDATLHVIDKVAGTGEHCMTLFFQECGNGTPATETPMTEPYDVAVGPDGSIYFAQRWPGYNVIRRVDPNGIVSTVAGSGPEGFSGDGGPATQAQLNFPEGIDIGPDGSLYITDLLNYRVRKVDPNGIITTVAGNGTGGYEGVGGLATQAQLDFLRDVAVAPDGNLYIVESYRILKVSPDGILTRIAGRGFYAFSGDDGPASEADLAHAWGIDFDTTGNIYIADLGNLRIRRIGTDGIIKTIAGNGQPCIAT